MPLSSLYYRKIWLIACLTLFFLYFATRLFHLLTMPLYVDEAIHLTRAQLVWQGYPLNLLVSGKAGPLYLIALFDPFQSPVLVGRVIIVLCGGIGLASIVGIGRALGSRPAGFLAGLLWVCSPYLFFLERQILVDAPLAALATFGAWLCIRMMKSGYLIDALLCGVVLALCVLDKLTGVVFLDLPFVALALPGLINRGRFRIRIRQMLAAYGATFLILALPVVYLVQQKVLASSVADMTTGRHVTLIDRLTVNSVLAIDAFTHYFNPTLLGLLLCLAAIAVLTQPRRALIGLALSAVPFAAVLVSGYGIGQRYLVIVVPGLFVLAVLGGQLIFNQIQQRGQNQRVARRLILATGVLLAALAVAQILPFIRAAYDDPVALPLPDNDRLYFIESGASGFGLPEVTADLTARASAIGHPVSVVGMITNCNALPFYLPPASPITVICPDIWDMKDEGVSIAQGISQARRSLADLSRTGQPFFMLTEQKGVIDLNVQGVPMPDTLIKHYARPGEENSINLYLVGATGS